MNEPDVIYLQLGDDYDPLIDNFKESEEVTWCTDSQFETDLTYCRVEPAELERLQAIEAAFFKIVSPDGFHQCGTYEDCPECESEGTHTPDCKLAAALDPK
jgi:hypothetical protein